MPFTPISQIKGETVGKAASPASVSKMEPTAPTLTASQRKQQSIETKYKTGFNEPMIKPFEYEAPTSFSDVFRETAKSLGNFPVNIANVPKKVLGAGSEFLKTIEEEKRMGRGITGGAYDIAAGFMGTITKPLDTLGNLGLGIVQDVVKKATGIEIPDERAKAVFNSAKEMFNNPMITAGDFAEAVNRLAVEDPMAIPLMLEGAGKALYGKEYDAVSRIGQAAGAGKIESGIAAAKSAAVKPFQDYMKEWSADVQKKSVIKLKTKLEEVFKGTKPAGREYQKSLKGDYDPAEFLADKAKGRPDMIPDIEGGKIKPQKQIDLLTNDVKPLNETMKKILAENPKRVSWEDISKRAMAEADSTYNRQQGVVADVQKSIGKEISAYKKIYGADGIDLNTLREIKIGQRIKSGVFEQTKPSFSNNGQYTLSNTARKLVIENADDFAVSELDKYIGAHYDAMDMLKTVSGNTVKGGRLGKYFAMGLGTSLGSAVGGVPGMVVGAAGGNWLTDLLQSTTLTNPMKNLILSKIQQSDPEIFRQALEYVKQSQTARAERLALPAAGKGTLGKIEVAPTPTRVRTYTGTKPEMGQIFEELPESMRTGTRQLSISPANIADRVKTDMLLQLEGQGFKSAVKKLSELDLSGVNSYDEFVGMVKGAMGKEAKLNAIDGWLKTAKQLFEYYK